MKEKKMIGNCWITIAYAIFFFLESLDDSKDSFIVPWRTLTVNSTSLVVCIK